MNLEKNEIKIQEDIESEKINLNDFYFLVNNPKETNQILEHFFDICNEFFGYNIALYNQLKSLNLKFSTLMKEKHYVNTSIKKIQSIIEKIINIQIKNLEIFDTKGDTFDYIGNKLLKLKKIIEEISPKFKNMSYNSSFYNKTTNLLFENINKTMNELEMKVIDDYIWEYYHKHTSDTCDKSVDSQLTEAKYLEKSLYEYFQTTKTQYFDRIKDSNNRVQKYYNDIKKSFVSYVSDLTELNTNLIKDLDNLKAEINSKEINEIINNNEILIFSNNDINLNEKDTHTIKYKIKLIKNNKIKIKRNNDIEDNKKNKQDITQKNQDLNDRKKPNQKKPGLKDDTDDYLFLNDKDKYEIISKLYSFNLKIMDKSQYDLELEKSKLDAIDFSKKILLYNEDSEETKFIEKYDEIIESINNKILNNIENIRAFFVVLNNYRVSGISKLKEKFFDLMIYIYTKTEEELSKNSDQNLENLLIILSQTYYKEIEGKKVYILEVIKSHEFYKKLEFWKNIIIKKIEDEFKKVKTVKIKRSSKNVISQNTKEDIISTQLIPFSEVMREFDFSKEEILEIYQKIFVKYECSESLKEQVLSFVNTVF